MPESLRAKITFKLDYNILNTNSFKLFVKTSMPIDLRLEHFEALKRRELRNNECNEIIEEIQKCSQSINHRLEYCRYHYFNLDNISDVDLRLDRSFRFRRGGDIVDVRYVYEANIAAFLYSLHVLLDSFPYLLNLFIQVEANVKSKEIGWHKNFISKYKSYVFYEELSNFKEDQHFKDLKAYVNTSKHSHMIRITNTGYCLEFEEFTYCNRTIKRRNVKSFLKECHDTLIPKFMYLGNRILQYKESQID